MLPGAEGMPLLRRGGRGVRAGWWKCAFLAAACSARQHLLQAQFCKPAAARLQHPAASLWA